MSEEAIKTVPVWTLSTTSSAQSSVQIGDGVLTSERLDELRSALAAFSEAPLVTLEAHPLPTKRDRSTGLPLEAVSPLAQELSRLVSQNATNVPAVAKVAESGEVLYRMIVPAKVAAQVGKGLVKPMKSALGGIYGGLVNAGSKSIAAQATFVPVSAAGATGAAAGTVAAGTAMTVAAPLILMAVAVGASAYADHQRQKAIKHITELLDKLHDDSLEQERSDLDGCRDAIDKATAILLDQGKVGASLGLDSAVHAISQATERAHRRLDQWELSLEALERRRVEVDDLERAFPGISKRAGRFRAYLEIAALAIAFKRRVIVLQGVEAGQSDPDNPFKEFVRSLRVDQQRVDELETRIARVLLRLSSLELHSSKQLRDKLMTTGEVDALLRASYRVRALADDVAIAPHASDVVIDIEKRRDGTLLVLPARLA